MYTTFDSVSHAERIKLIEAYTFSAEDDLYLFMRCVETALRDWMHDFSNIKKRALSGMIIAYYDQAVKRAERTGMDRVTIERHRDIVTLAQMVQARTYE